MYEGECGGGIKWYVSMVSINMLRSLWQTLLMIKSAREFFVNLRPTPLIFLFATSSRNCLGGGKSRLTVWLEFNWTCVKVNSHYYYY